MVLQTLRRVCGIPHSLMRIWRRTALILITKVSSVDVPGDALQTRKTNEKDPERDPEKDPERDPERKAERYADRRYMELPFFV